MDLGFDDYGFMFDGSIASLSSPSHLPVSPQNDFFEGIDFALPADVVEDGRPCGSDADILRVNAAAAPQAAPPVPVEGGGYAAPWCATGGRTTEIQHLEVEDAQRRLDSWKRSDVEQRLFAGVEHLTAPPDDEKLAPAPEDGLPSCRDADMAEVNAAFNDPPARLTYQMLKEITDNFSHERVLGEGHFGTVYKGVLRNGDTIAVKKLHIGGLHDDAQFEKEFRNLAMVKHPNIVRLVGYCSEMKLERPDMLERWLCMEYMPKGSLRRHLSDETSGLDWSTRFEIIKGICSGLHYLHEECQATPTIHGDLKPANIFLDDNMMPKLADFGLSRLFGDKQTRACTTSCKETQDYMAPEYLEKDVITKRSDIFSLGTTIMEIITGRKDYPTDETKTSHQQYIDLVLKNWRHRLTKAQGYTSQDIDYQQIKKCIQIGLLCVKFDPVKRPTIKEIMKMLEKSEEEAQSSWFESWKSTILQDLFPEVLQPDTHRRTYFQNFNREELRSRLSSWERMKSGDFQSGELSDSKRVSIVSFTGPDSKGKKAQQGRRCWKEKSTKGMRAVADPSPQPPGRRQQQRYVSLKKTLELEDDGNDNGSKWRAHEYTPLLPSDDGTNKLIPAEISLRIEFKEDEAPSSSPTTLSTSSLKRSITGAPKTAPSEVWDHMTRLHVKVTPKDGSKRKKPYYKAMYAICQHCDQVLNADPDNGTHNLNNHVKRCKCNCTQSHSD